jgi:hypothetical protein
MALSMRPGRVEPPTGCRKHQVSICQSDRPPQIHSRSEIQPLDGRRASPVSHPSCLVAVWVRERENQRPQLRRQSNILISLKLDLKSPSIFYGECIPIVIEICPNPFCPAFLNALRPDSKFLAGVIVTIPARRPVKANIDIISSRHELIRKPRGTTRAEDCSRFSECLEDCLVPPARVTELHHVSTFRVELRDDSLKRCRGVVEAGGKLE